MPLRNAYTVFDVMDRKGVFRLNPANAEARADDGSVLYKGPVPYPKMLYHPEGKHRVVEGSRVEPTPVGPVTIPAKTELIYKIAQNADEEKELREAGWHDHPSKAAEAAAKLSPVKSDADRIKELEAQLATLEMNSKPSKSASA